MADFATCKLLKNLAFVLLLAMALAGFYSCGKKSAPQKSVFDMTNSTSEADSLAKVERAKKTTG